MIRAVSALVFSGALLITLAGSSAAQTSATCPVSYSVDKAHSSVGFVVRHLGISRVRGSFSDYDATVSFDGSDLSTLTTAATIRTESVDSGVERRDNHLRSADFFDAATYPDMTFESVRVENIDGMEFDLIGNLTILDTTREVTLRAEYFGTAGDRAGFSAVGEILRKEFGLTWDRVTEAGNIVVSNTVKIELELELKQQ